MQQYTDTVLYKTHQHFIVVFSKFLRIFLPYSLAIYILGNFLFEWNIFFQLIGILFGGFIIFAWYYFFWVKSYFIISNEKIIIKVRNGIFSKFHMSIHYKNIRDMAFSKNNIFHYMFGYGTFFARSSAGAVGDLEATHIPHIQRVYRAVNYLYNLSEDERKNISVLDEVISGKEDIFSKKESQIIDAKQDTTEEIYENMQDIIVQEKQVLLSIQGIKEVVLLSDREKRYIFEHEQEKNHGVHEAIRRQVVFAVTHDSTFREPDEAIVLQAGGKVIFPSVEFHEIRRRNVCSSSPGIEIHNFLAPKFSHLSEHDASLIIGFDI